jgi:steroid delta-isomerase-like uncharacterized protein
MNYLPRLLFPLLAILFCSALVAQQPAKSLSTNKLLALRFCNEIINEQKVDLVDSLVAPNYKEHQADRHYLNTRYGLKRGLHNFLKAFPDVHVRINFMTEQDNIVTAQYTLTATQAGHMYQHKATHHKINVEGVDIIRIENGKMTEHWGYLEEARLLRQLRKRPSQINENDIMGIDTAKSK